MPRDTPEMRKFLVDTIIGSGFPSIEFAYRCEQAGLADYAGGDQSPAWSWRRKILSEFTLGELQEVYDAAKSCANREVIINN